MVIQKNRPMRERVYEILKKMIIDGEISPEEKIVETEYAEKFQISRTPLREAIRMLELEGYVESHSKGGVIVKNCTKEDVEEIYKIRIALEGIILEEVIKKSSQSDIKKLENILKETKKIMVENKNNDDVFKLFSKFNNTLYSIAKMSRVEDLIKNMNLYLKRFRKMAVEDFERKKQASDDHVELVNAIKEKDINKALEINKIHLERSKNFIISEI
ncbi:GntR family transcriptional regulator [uncultured Ilyobacter sp.]|uniref:GntR family transcriptional regulator n=1 Tax=uncultured Ilyobacter sp. TaxID=544433 RepID=UPI0029F5661E|nr:GntR family transcriptional regulator [uncultured Ilyobacter sp.]